MEVAKRKFSSKEINGLFDMLNDDKTIKQLCTGKGCQDIMPVTLRSFNSSDQASILSNLKSPKFNAYACIYVTHVYENFPKGQPFSAVEQLKIAKAKAAQFLSRVTELLEESRDPLYSSLKVELVNKETTVVRTYADPHDDGDDWYGTELFLKFTFK